MIFNSMPRVTLSIPLKLMKTIHALVLVHNFMFTQLYYFLSVHFNIQLPCFFTTLYEIFSIFFLFFFAFSLLIYEVLHLRQLSQPSYICGLFSFSFRLQIYILIYPFTLYVKYAYFFVSLNIFRWGFLQKKKKKKNLF